MSINNELEKLRRTDIIKSLKVEYIRVPTGYNVEGSVKYSTRKAIKLKIDVNAIDELYDIGDGYVIMIGKTFYHKSGGCFINDYFNRSDDYMETLHNLVKYDYVYIFNRGNINAQSC